MNRYAHRWHGAGIVAVLIAALLLTAGPAIAQSGTPASGQATGTPGIPDIESRAFEFYPTDTGWGSFLAPTIEPGTSTELTVTLANTGEVTQDLRIYAVDAFTANGGGFAAAEYGTSPNDVTAWVDLPDTVFTLEPGQGIEHTFTVTVPDGAAPGQYITAVVGSQAVPFEIEGTDMLTQVLRYPVPLFITVPGETTAGFETGEITLESHPEALVATVELINTGDVRVRPRGTIDLLDADGALLASYPVEMQSIYAHDRTTLSIGFPVIAALDAYQIQVDLTDDETGTVAQTTAAKLVAISAATPVAAQFSIANPSATPGPSADQVQFATIEATLTNAGDPVSNAQLSLIAALDGAEVERFPINQSLALPSGDTQISTRYIPVTGWSPGAWTFELVLETVDASGVAVVVARAAIPETIEIS